MGKADILIRTLPPTEAYERREEIRHLMDQVIPRSKSVVRWEDVEWELVSGKMGVLAALTPDDRLVGMCGFKLVPYYSEVIGRLCWVVGKGQFKKARDRVLEEVEEIFRNLGVRTIEFWARPGFKKYLAEKGYESYEVSYVKKLED